MSRSWLPVTTGRSIVAIIATLVSAPAVAIVAASPASACTDSDDVNALCSNEQAFMKDLAAVGIVPTSTPRVMVNRGNQLCGDMYRGVPRSVVVQQVYGGTSMHLNQAQAIVAAAERYLCNFAVTGFEPRP
ncbi:DUF732 domain-containing protein [Mycolicibacterium sp. 018/SC-01/001]|nr:DUF732 domain-containing protein [Mycolicibacterium sp. 018/SC-01/001]